MAAPAIGIDLGTTFSCVAVVRRGKVEIIENDKGNRITPSYVAFTDTARLIGNGAKSQVEINPSNTVFDAKRLIGRKYTDSTVQSDMKHWPFKVVNDGDKPKFQVEYKGEVKTFAAEEISSMVLTKMKQTAEAFLGQKVTDAVITVPAYFNDSQRLSTKDAGVIAGLNVKRVIDGPTAAALAYGIDKNLRGAKNVLIFDVGGGTSDVSIVIIEDGSRFTVKSTAGDTHLGGEDFDNRMVDYHVKEFKNKYGNDISDNARALRRLRSACEVAKRDLSCHTVARIDIDSLNEDVDYNTKITRASFEELCSDLFRQTIELVEKALQDAKLDKQYIHEVVLVGGSTRIPKIQELLKEFMGGKELNKSINADEAVAYGAAVLAAVEDEAVKDVLLVDVAPLSLWIETAGRAMTKLNVKLNIPNITSEPFTTYSEIQSGVKIEVVEGEGSGIRQFKVTISIDADVSVEDDKTGKSNKVRIMNDKSRLSKEDRDKMVEDAERYLDEDNKQRDRVQAKNNLESLSFQYKRAVNDDNGKLSAGDKKTVIKKCDDVIRWLESNTSAEKEEYEVQKSNLQKWCLPITEKLHGGSGNGDDAQNKNQHKQRSNEGGRTVEKMDLS